METDYKYQVAQNFGNAAPAYNRWASIQQECAETLISILRHQSKIPDGEILEIGCGTGFITQKLIEQFPDRHLEITDISPEMLEFCQRNLLIASQPRSLSFNQLDGETVNTEAVYAAIVGGFVIQWFEQPLESLQRLVAALQPGGVLLVSFPSDRSFPEWKQACQQTSIPFTANPLPNPGYLSEQLTDSSVKCTWYEKEFCLVYRDAIEFFKSFKLIGASLNRYSQMLTARQMRQLIHHWNLSSPNEIQVHYIH
ncbi:MAG: methyltransferase, partial [Leptolyngbyaceae cyanobacterium SL_7_1]|nr:methyltransferase [Leptolyngbyaceae cyanobacterium SL_7_1]